MVPVAPATAVPVAGVVVALPAGRAPARSPWAIAPAPAPEPHHEMRETLGEGWKKIETALEGVNGEGPDGLHMYRCEREGKIGKWDGGWISKDPTH